MKIQHQHHLDSILPLKQLSITCRFKQKTKLPCFHQTVFPAYLYTLLDRLPPEQAKISCRFILPENGRTYYQQDDLYTFSIVLFGKHSDDIAINLVQKLNQGISTEDARTLHNNLEVVQLVDTFSGKVIDDIAELENSSTLSSWGRQALNSHCHQLASTTEFRLWFDTGVIFKQKLQNSKDLTAKRLFQQLYLAVLYATDIPIAEKTQLASDLSHSLKSLSTKLTDTHVIPDCHLFYLNKTYANNKGQFKHLSGYHGYVDVHLPLDFTYRNEWLQLLLIGQYLGIGKRTNYTLGQYHIVANNKVQKFSPAPSRPLLEDVLDIRHFIHNTEYAKLSDDQKQQVLSIRDDILARRYQPSPLQTYQHTQTKLNGQKKTRQLAVAPLAERMVQKVVAKTLSHMIDDAQHKSSYGYRPNRNRKQAIARIQKNIKYGSNWILESDIEDCFDSIRYSVVATRLRAVCTDDDLMQYVMDCLATPSAEEVKQNAPSRRCGIPQGSPLSPIIANLVLTDLDYDLSQQGFYHVRFADDFVVCGKTRQQIEQALIACKKSLAEHGLSLNEDKTHITQVAENFIFLGYQINDKQAIDLSGQHRAKGQMPLNPDIIEQTGVSGISHRGQTLFVCYKKHAQLSLSSNHLLISSNDVIERTPLAHIRLIILLGGHHVTTPLAQYCLSNGIDIHYLRHTGKYLGSLSSIKANNQYKTNLWLQQETLLTNDKNALKLSKLIISARLYNMRKTLVGYQLKNLTALDSKLKQIETAKDLHELRGYEGVATRFYYLQLNVLLQKTNFEFKARTRRPPKDPFNVLLSLGYTILYNYLTSFLLTLDINPDRGFYHYTQSNSIALCSDLIEPFRHWIEKASITVIRRRQIQLKHFYYHNQACCLTAVGRRVYLHHLAQMLESSSKHGNIFKQRHIEKIYKQAVSFKKYLQHPDVIIFETFKE